MQRKLFRVAAALLTVVLLQATGAGEGPSPAEIDELIEQLDADRFADREAATHRLGELGLDGVPRLRAALADSSAEARARLKRVIRAIRRRELTPRFARLAATPDDRRIDVETGMWLISSLVDDTVSRAEINRELDRLADEVRKALRAAAKGEAGDDAGANGAEAKAFDVKTVDPATAVAALRRVLFDEAGFTGNTTTYDDPRNSSLHHVLKSRRGLPILLSHVVVSVGERLEIPIVGLGVPGRYMCKYDGARAPGGPADDIILDPYGGGRILTVDELRQEIRSFDPEEHLQPHGHRATLRRMLSNLVSDYEEAGDTDRAARAAEYGEMFAEVEE